MSLRMLRSARARGGMQRAGPHHECWQGEGDDRVFHRQPWCGQHRGCFATRGKMEIVMLRAVTRLRIGCECRALQLAKGNLKWKRWDPSFATDLQDLVAKKDGEGDDDREGSWEEVAVGLSLLRQVTQLQSSPENYLLFIVFLLITFPHVPLGCPYWAA